MHTSLINIFVKIHQAVYLQLVYFPICMYEHPSKVNNKKRTGAQIVLP